MGKIYMGNLKKQLRKGLQTAQVAAKVWPIAKKAFEKKKREFIKEFNKHPITEEIERGPTARSNISGTLPGLRYEAGKGGNLFSFIGFNKTDQPIQDLRRELKWRITLRPGDVKIRKASKSQYSVVWKVTYKAKYPTLQELAKVTPMPWEPGSWIKKIENGISGLGYYIWQRKGFSNSRSGMAVQGTNQMRQTMFVPKPYINEIVTKVFPKKTK